MYHNMEWHYALGPAVLVGRRDRALGTCMQWTRSTAQVVFGIRCRSMALNHLPSQPPLFPPEAEEYSRRALALSADAIGRCDVRMDIAYDADPRQALDIYRPQAPFRHPLPILLFVHGGGWTNGYKEWVGLFGPSITAFPALLVSVSYRLAPANRFPAPFRRLRRGNKVGLQAHRRVWRRP
jgi:acetyl esterase/lipase